MGEALYVPGWVPRHEAPGGMRQHRGAAKFESTRSGYDPTRLTESPNTNPPTDMRTSPQSHGHLVDSKTPACPFYAAVVSKPLFLRLPVITFCTSESFAGPVCAHLRIISKVLEPIAVRKQLSPLHISTGARIVMFTKRRSK